MHYTQERDRPSTRSIRAGEEGKGDERPVVLNNADDTDNEDKREQR